MDKCFEYEQHKHYVKVMRHASCHMLQMAVEHSMNWSQQKDSCPRIETHTEVHSVVCTA